MNLFFENLLNLPFLTWIPTFLGQGLNPSGWILWLKRPHIPNSAGSNVKMHLLQWIRYQGIDWRHELMSLLIYAPHYPTQSECSNSTGKCCCNQATGAFWEKGVETKEIEGELLSASIKSSSYVWLFCQARRAVFDTCHWLLGSKLQSQTQSSRVSKCWLQGDNTACNSWGLEVFSQRGDAVPAGCSGPCRMLCPCSLPAHVAVLLSLMIFFLMKSDMLTWQPMPHCFNLDIG